MTERGFRATGGQGQAYVGCELGQAHTIPRPAQTWFEGRLYPLRKDPVTRGMWPWRLGTQRKAMESNTLFFCQFLVLFQPSIVSFLKSISLSLFTELFLMCFRLQNGRR